MTATEAKTDVSAQTNLPASYVVAKEPVAKMKRTLQGRVVSNKMQKTVTALIERKVKHEMYGKYMSVSKKYHAHAEAAYNEGDLVELQEGRPISKTKAWTVTKLLQAASV